MLALHEDSLEFSTSHGGFPLDPHQNPERSPCRRRGPRKLREDKEELSQWLQRPRDGESATQKFHLLKDNGPQNPD